MSEFKYSNEQLKDLLDGIYDGSITKYAIPEDLYFAIADYLKSGLYKGFGGNLGAFKGKDLELLTELRENIYMFSGGKAYHQIDDISSLLLNAGGKRRTINEFSALGRETFETWNDAWGRTEYNTAIESAMQAIKWNEIQRNKDLLPVLVYVTTEAACTICSPLSGFTARVDHPIWNKIYPINHFNCNCHVEQREDGTKLTENIEDVTGPVLKEMPDTFKINCGKEGSVFGPGHPYFNVPKADRKYAEANFGLPIPNKD